MKPRAILTYSHASRPVDATPPGKCGLLRHSMTIGIAMLSLCTGGMSVASPAELGRLFYTPAQRAQLESARTHNVTQVASQPRPTSPPPLRYDGVLMRSDGQTTRWVDGKAQADSAGVAGLKPGQIRAGDKVYEPYQVVRPTPASPDGPVTRETTP
jgi:hypothetical protein